MVQREPGTLIELFVLFVANAIGCKGLGHCDHEAWKAFEARAAGGNVAIRPS